MYDTRAPLATLYTLCFTICILFVSEVWSYNNICMRKDDACGAGTDTRLDLRTFENPSLIADASLTDKVTAASKAAAWGSRCCKASAMA